MAPTIMTADELLHTSIPGKRTELVRGVLVVRELNGFQHGRVATDLAFLLSTCAKGTGAGEVVMVTGFQLAADPDTVRAPDVAFVRAGRITVLQTDGYPPLSPDLVVDVLSPDDRPGEILAKVADWLEGGTRLVWVIDPERRITRIYRHDGTESVLGEDHQLDGEDVLPGFACRLASVL